MKKLSVEEVLERKRRLKVAIALHEIEGNPLSQEEVDMFEMFDREGWSHEKSRAFILDKYKNIDDKPHAAE